jgi:serine/threonine protein kinase/Tol biopolymer transport system component
MELKRGDTVGAYEIVGPIGAGGMGEVYRARDPRLGRDVALKFLADRLAGDPDRTARFEREARSLAALSHHGIVGIYAIESHAERLVIVMEYVDGRTLDEIVGRGGLPIDRLLHIAVQISGAVAAAHRQGIVHRDLKPSNVMVQDPDRVKVLDFGLAKLSAQATQEAETMPAANVITGEGKIVGTVSYMSPEQAEGKTVDERSDIFSLGVLLYEMASGQRPFKGDTSLSVLSAILRDTPKPLSDINPKVPREVARVVRRCLAKNPDDRYQSAADLRSDLEDIRQSLTSGELQSPAAPIMPVARRIAAAAVVIAAIIAIGFAAWPRRGVTSPQLPALSFTRLTLLEGVTIEPVISPDGKWVAYVNGLSGNQDIYLQSTSGQTTINLTKDSPLADRMPAFSPDGELIAFRSERDGGGIFVMGRTGESVRRLTKTGFQPSWFPDGRTIVYASLQVPSPDSRGGGASELWTIDMNGGEPKKLFGGDAVQPRVSPNGKRVAYWSMPVAADYSTFLNPNRDIWTIGVDGRSPVPVTTDVATDWNPVWSPDGNDLYFLSNRSGTMNLWRIAIDQSTGRTAGEPIALTTPSTYVRHFTLSADGRVATYANLANVSNLARVRFDQRTLAATGPIENITTGPRDFLAFDINPTDGQVVLMTNFGLQEDLLLVSPPDNTLRYLTSDRYRDRNPRWSRDGRHIFFYSDRLDNYEVFSIDKDGSGLRRLTDTEGKRFYPVPSPDGSTIVTADINSYELFLYDAADFSKPPKNLGALPIDARGTNFIPQEWSPDGKFISGYSGPRVWIYSLETRAFRVVPQIAGIGTFTAYWFADGRRILANRQGSLVAADIETGAMRPVLSIPGEVIGSARISADGSYLYFLHGTSTGDVWVMRFGTPPGTTTDSK